MRVLLADDHAVFRVGLRHLLTQLGQDINTTEAGTAAEVVNALGSGRFDLAVIDLDMPGLDGRAVGRVGGAASVRLVGISDDLSPVAVRHALDAGFAGYVPKNASPEVMLSALKIVLSGERYAPVASLGPTEPAAGAGGGDTARPGPVLLTRRQRDIMRLLAQGKQNRDIAHLLGVAEGTVKAHVANIFKTLKVNNRTAAAATAQKLGLLP